MLLDVFDVPTQLGFPLHHINWDAAGLLCGNLVVIALYIITYLALDKRSIQKEHNRRRVAIYMMQAAVDACHAQIDLLNNSGFMESLLSKIDSGDTLDNNPIVYKMLTLPFDDHEAITAFAADGVISEEEFVAYHMVKNAFRMFVTSSLTFHDVEELKSGTEQAFVAAVEIAQELLKA